MVVGIAQPYLDAENNGTPIKDVIASIKAGKTVTLKDPKQEPTADVNGLLKSEIPNKNKCREPSQDPFKFKDRRQNH